MRVSAPLVLLFLAVYNGVGEAAKFPGFFIPEEWQTILSVFYSHLPPTKIGSDKRFGVGFRLGRNADAQILVELGPQSETQPLAESGGFSKRESGKPADSRRQKTAGRFSNDSKNKRKTADVKTSGFEAENTKAAGQETTRNPAVQQLNNVLVTEQIEKENNTESTTFKTKKRRKRPKKKVKPFEEQTEEGSSPTNNEISTNINSQNRPEMFLNNFMSWLQRFNQDRNTP